MSDIRGGGYGSAHNWKHSHTSAGRQTRYDCRDCDYTFWHDYPHTPDIFEAMEKVGVPKECQAAPKEPPMIDTRSNAEKHSATARIMANVVLELRRALKEQRFEDGSELEWAGAIRDVLCECELLHRRLAAYGK